MTTSYVIKGGSLPNGKKSDLVIADGVIKEMATEIAPSGHTVIDAADSILLPGLVDLHTHLREPGKEDAETVLSGSQAGVLFEQQDCGRSHPQSVLADLGGLDRRRKIDGRARDDSRAGGLELYQAGRNTD